jgi:hypothetical protein
MNLIWGLLHVHYGAINAPGSLSHFFALLEKVRLGGEHPDFHTLLAALTQILDGLLLNAWRRECSANGYANLDAFAASNPTPEELLRCARLILEKYATPTEILPPALLRKKLAPKAKNDDEESDSDSEAETSPLVASDDNDIVHENVLRLTRDLLYVTELVSAIADGDFGRIEDILPDLACVFRAAGSNKYATEILHWISNVKNVWTPDFANIMCDTMLVNPSGLPGHAMGIDMNIEHMIGYLKVCLSVSGKNSGSLSAGLDTICRQRLSF